LAAPTVLGVIDTYGIELIHPMREGRSPQQIGRKASPIIAGLSAAKLCLLLNQYGLVVAWACDPPMSRITPFRGSFGSSKNA